MSPNMSPMPATDVADAIADPTRSPITDPVADSGEHVAHAAEQHAADQHAREHVAAAPAAVVALSPRRVRLAALPVGHPLSADLHRPDVRIGAGEHPFGVGRTGRDGSRHTAGGCPVDVVRGRAVRRVEEARGALGRQRLTGDPGLDAGDRVPTVLEDLGDVPDLVGLWLPRRATSSRCRTRPGHAGSPAASARRARARRRRSPAAAAPRRTW